jgi:hypothetical protein
MAHASPQAWKDQRSIGCIICRLLSGSAVAAGRQWQSAPKTQRIRAGKDLGAPTPTFCMPLSLFQADSDLLDPLHCDLTFGNGVAEQVSHFWEQ